jgi:hypothetical protein
VNAEATKASYRRALKERVTIRRYTGTGANRPRFDIENVRTRIVGYEPHELVGTIQQGDRKAIIYADDLMGRGLALPITNADKLVVRGKELAIVAADDSTRRVEGVLIAIELQVRG